MIERRVCNASEFCTKTATHRVIGSGWSFEACNGHTALLVSSNYGKRDVRAFSLDD